MKALEIIKKRRIQLKISQRELSENLKLPLNGCQKIENGSQNLKLDEFLKVIKILNIPITSFSDTELLVISKDDLDNIKKATELLNSVANKLKNQEINISDNHGTININQNNKE